MLSWKIVGGDNVQATLKVRPFYSGRDFHSTQPREWII